MKKSFKRWLCSTMAALLVAALIPVAAFAAPADGQLLIFHTNDTHGRIVGDGKNIIGFDKIAGLVKAEKEAGKHVLLLDAGDTFHGQTLITVPKGETAVDIMNAMGYDAMTTGNHDYNYGYKRLEELAGKAKFPVLAANVKDESGKLILKDHIVKEIGGVKVGIFGLATPETTVKTNPNNVKGLVFEDPVKAAGEQVKALKEAGAEFIIALVHLGIDEESVGMQSYDVRDKVEGIDLIIDGHSHSVLDKIEQAPGKAVITSTGGYDSNLGEVTVDFKDGKATITPKNISVADMAATTPDPEVTKIVAAAEEAIKPIISEVIGKTEVLLEGTKSKVRGGETNLSHLITDAMMSETGADAAFTNGGGIRDSIKVGDITKNDVITVLPFGNYVITLKVTGKAIVEALEHGTSDYPEPQGRMAQVAGITYTLNLSAEKGHRVEDVKIGGKSVEMEKEYVLATNDFMAVGGDGYTMFKGAKEAGQYNGLDEILIQYVQKLGTLTEKNLAFEPRMKVVGTAPVKQETTTPAAVTVQPVQPAEQAKPVEPAKPVLEPAKPAKPAEPATPAVYVVKKGDYLSKIAKLHNTTWKELAKINKLRNPNLIYPGQVLKLAK